MKKPKRYQWKSTTALVITGPPIGPPSKRLAKLLVTRQETRDKQMKLDYERLIFGGDDASV